MTPLSKEDVQRLGAKAELLQLVGNGVLFRDARYAYLAAQANWLDEQIGEGKTIHEALVEFRRQGNGHD